MKPNGSRVWRGGRALRLLGLILGMLGLTGNSHAENIRVFPEPWQVLEPGKPMVKPPQVEILTRGSGVAIEPGDLVQIAVKTKVGPEGFWKDKGDWWLWVGFQERKSSDFFVNERFLASAMIGQQQGAVLAFSNNGNNPEKDAEIVARLSLNPIGDTKYYDGRKNLIGSFVMIYVSGHQTPSTVEVKRVCKGKAQYRTVRLFDDSPVQRCTWAPIQCSMIDTPREGWIDEARIEAVCQDGRTATFQYGPVASRNGKEWTGPINPHNYFEPWEAAAWKKLPVGVQLK